MAPCSSSTSAVVYGSWVMMTTASSTVTAATTDTTWNEWTSDTTAATDYSTWGVWNGPEAKVVYRTPRIVTPEEARKQEARRRSLQAKKEREEREAETKAEILLKQFLDESQLADFYKHRRFRLKVGEREYEIDCTKRMHNVFEVVDGKLTKEHCIYAGYEVPLCDNALAQKLLLETNEKELVRIANQTIFHRPQESPLGSAS